LNKDVDNNPVRGRVTIILSLAMAVLFVGLGCLLVFTTINIEDYPRPQRYWLGGILLLWAAFRGATVYLRWKKLKQHDEDFE
jgi:hypothetical protein